MAISKMLPMEVVVVVVVVVLFEREGFASYLLSIEEQYLHP
jgi:hypothetical protein